MAANQNDDRSVPPPSTAGLVLNIADLNINRENMFLDDPDDLYINAVADNTLYASTITFEELNLLPEVIRGLYREIGFKRPSKIQAITLPMISSPSYKDLIAQAHNGTGKTTCFGLEMLGRVDPNLRAPQALHLPHQALKGRGTLR
ncbi:hypothetical protein ACFX12_009383 [Malus domestica]